MKKRVYKKAVMPQVMPPQVGNGFWDWVKGAANTVKDGLQKSKIISTVAPLLLPGPAGAAVGTVARNVGLGKMKKQKGKGKKLIKY